jgi:hypothetical protein
MKQPAMWAIGVVVGLGLAGCGSNVVVDRATTSGAGAKGQGGGTATSTTTTGTGGGTTTTTSTVTAGCPATAPMPGSACEGAANCTYGGGPCPAEFACIQGQWAQAGDCPQPACPANKPDPGASCPAEGQQCHYDMQCSGAQATCTNGTWHVEEYGVGCAEMCPADVPADGSFCDVCCAPPSCEYPVKDCSPTRADCGQDGHWHVQPGDCQPPPPMSMCGFHGDEQECKSDPDCRWLTPGCMDPILPAAGCFSLADCATDFDCGGQHCKLAVYDPCYEKGCDACAAKAMLCLP